MGYWPLARRWDEWAIGQRQRISSVYDLDVGSYLTMDKLSEKILDRKKYPVN